LLHNWRHCHTGTVLGLEKMDVSLYLSLRVVREMIVYEQNRTPYLTLSLSTPVTVNAILVSIWHNHTLRVRPHCSLWPSQLSLSLSVMSCTVCSKKVIPSTFFTLSKRQSTKHRWQYWWSMRQKQPPPGQWGRLPERWFEWYWSPPSKNCHLLKNNKYSNNTGYEVTLSENKTRPFSSFTSCGPTRETKRNSHLFSSARSNE